MTAVCFGCSGRFERAQLEDVGDTVFCRACLDRMLRRVDERGASLREARGEILGGIHGNRQAPVTPPPVDAPCFICGAPLEGTAFVELRGFAICARCSRGLVGDDLPAPAAANDDVPARDVPRDEPRGLRQALRGPAIATPGTGTEWCSRCGRAMPGPGSYQLVDGRPHCASCVAARAPRLAEPVAEPGEPTAEPPAPPATCEACQRAVSPAALRETRGFWLCVACLDSDAELALALARAHHRRRLERAGRRILDGEDA